MCLFPDLSKYHITQRVVFPVWRIWHAIASELRSRLAQVYDDDGGGFSFFGAGLGHPGAYNIPEERWISWEWAELERGHMQKSRNREMLHKRQRIDKVGREILSRQRVLAAHDALSSIKESPEAVKACVARHEEERNQEINNIASQFPELEAIQDALIILGPRIQGIQDKADCLALKMRMLDLTSTSPSEAHTSARDIVIPDSQPASDLDARDSTEYIDDADESNDEEEEEEEEEEDF